MLAGQMSNQDEDEVEDELEALQREIEGAVEMPDVPTAALPELTEEEKENLPLRIPLGTDALNIMRLKCTQTLESLQIWETFACSTDFADMVTIPSYYR